MFSTVKNKLSIGLAATLIAASFLSLPAYAGSCDGTVRGLSSTYNLKKGSGFLAIRSRATSKSAMKGQLFNGNVIEIDRRKGNWLYIYSDNGSGWVFAKYVRRTCDGI